MVVSRKPVTSKASEADIERIISGGLDKASPATPTAPAAAPAGVKNHPLRFPPDGALYHRLEKALQAAPVKLPRNTFILQAIAEKLEREGY